MAEQRVLLVDLDPQANLTSGLGLKGQTPGGTIYDALTSESPDAPLTIVADDASRASSLIPADRQLTGAEVELVSLPNRERRLQHLLAPVRDAFDVIFIDTPPSLGLLTLNALVAADAVLIPLTCEYFALEGLADLVATLRRVRGTLNPSLDIAGVLLTMYDERTNLGQQVARGHSRVLPGSRLPERHPAQRPARRSAESRRAGDPLRRQVARRRPPTSPSPASSSRACRRARRRRTRSLTMVEKRPALGRGLSALIPDAPASPQTSARPLEVDTDLLTPNRFQPRTTMDDGRIEELARSIRSNGIIQPIVVRKADTGYEIVAGERRWRASQRAGLLKVPIVVRDIPDDRLLAAALIENLQREDLNPMEEAHAYRRLADEFHLTQEQIADAVGKDRSSVANMIAAAAAAARSARERRRRRDRDGPRPRAPQPARRGRAAALGPRGRRQAAVGSRNRSAGEEGADARPRRARRRQKDVHTRAAEDRLRFALGTAVRIVRKGKGGRIEIDFTSEEELQRLYEQMVNENSGITVRGQRRVGGRHGSNDRRPGSRSRS